MKAAFIVTARDKAKYVAKAVKSALDQTYPCHIYLSDQGSTDGTYEVMEKTVAELGVPERHKVELIRCPIEGPYGMRAANEHTLWLMGKCEEDWVFQCSADDYSLPQRVEKCMAAMATNPCSAVACTVYFTRPEMKEGQEIPVSGYPRESGYVSGGQGLTNLAYGSTIQGWNRQWFLKVGSAGDVTGDVYHGYLASLDKGYYVIAEPHHVHVQHASFDNMGFEGKMRAAQASGDQETMTRINELNRFQLFELYFMAKIRQQQLYPLAHHQDTDPLVTMILSQAGGWLQERKNLHANKWTPGIL